MTLLGIELSAIANLAVRMAHADGHMDTSEIDVIANGFKYFNVPLEQAKPLILMAMAANEEDAISDYDENTMECEEIEISDDVSVPNLDSLNDNFANEDSAKTDEASSGEENDNIVVESDTNDFIASIESADPSIEETLDDEKIDYLEEANDEFGVEPSASIPENSNNLEIQKDVKAVLSYMDKLLGNLPEDKIEEFARSEHFEVYKKLFNELGISE